MNTNRILECLFVACVYVLSACEKAPEEIPVTSVSITQPSAEMLIGETVQLKASVSPGDATDKTVSWASSKQSVATVSETGLVTAIAEGSSTITASAGGKNGSCIVTVSKGVIAVSSVDLNKTELSLVEGDSEALFVSIKPDDATDKTVTWSTSNASIATVDNGKVTAIKEGEATITARVGDKSATCKVVVTKKVIAVESVVLNKTSVELVEGDAETLTATVKPDNATDKTVTWSTSDAAIATVDNGKVTAVKEGEATITAKAGDKSATCKVVVAKKVIAVESVELNKTSVELVEGEAETLTATVKPDNATDKTVTWSTSDASIATVDNGKVTAIKEGEATITATAGEQFATCQITVIHDAANDPIVFADERIKTKLVAAFDKNGDSELSYKEASAAKSLSGVFGTDTDFSSFDEFQYFTGVKKIENNLFKNWSIESIILPSSIITIGNSAFQECLFIKTIILPESVTSLGESAFNNCSNLLSVTASNGLKTIGRAAFSNCTVLKSFSIPTSVTSIGPAAFYGCEQIVSVEIPNGVTSIGEDTFYGCKNLTTVTIPESVTSLGVLAFARTKIDSITIPSGVSRLEAGLFFECPLTTINIMGNLVYIGSSVFYNCYKLKSFELPETLGFLGEAAFHNCGIESVVIPSKLSSIPARAFEYCGNLSTIIIPINITSLGKYSFSSCSGLKSIYVESSTPPEGAMGMFSSVTCPIYVPSESVDDYKTAEYWSDYASKIQAIP